MRAARLRVELQAEVDGRRDALFPLVSTADGLRRWMDDATLDPRVGGGFRFRLLDAVAVGRVQALDPVQHIGYCLGLGRGSHWAIATTVAFDLIAHGSRTHLTVAPRGLPDCRPGRAARCALAPLVPAPGGRDATHVGARLRPGRDPRGG